MLPMGFITTLSMEIASKLPFRYTGAVILGSNISGIIVATINIISISISPNPRTAAIYYFITALFILLACFDTYFALPLNRFFRYHDYQYKKGLQLKKKSAISSSIGTMQCTNPTGVISSRTSSLVRRLNHLPFWTIFRNSALGSKPSLYQRNTTLLLPASLRFNFGAMLGNLIATYVHFPSPSRENLACYVPLGCGILDGWSLFFGLTGGYLSAIAIMYCPRSVEPEYAATAGMFGASSIATGIISGIAVSYSMPVLVSNPELQFELPSWWPQFTPN
ncbi:SLC29A1_2_3 [Lepeophtheirus salmonis]|uniref:SLC29A1_2_3 n=1 Tax=Lepeophtheirus salmonis TaxID=72036 RepID=A0A7R8HD15_LEPSM|nr:SLC29A1_2_3 [Lepeophtheirus salmonis]CAF3014369.1 SLC29A1_2_3 [Lepeophtheirus salmonis]